MHHYVLKVAHRSADDGSPNCSDVRLQSPLAFPNEESVSAIQNVPVCLYVRLNLSADRARITFFIRRELVQSLARGDKRNGRPDRRDDQVALDYRSANDPRLQGYVRAIPIHIAQNLVGVGDRLLQYLADRSTCRVVRQFNRRQHLANRVTADRTTANQFNENIQISPGRAFVSPSRFNCFKVSGPRIAMIHQWCRMDA